MNKTKHKPLTKRSENAYIFNNYATLKDKEIQDEKFSTSILILFFLPFSWPMADNRVTNLFLQNISGTMNSVVYFRLTCKIQCR